MRGPARPPGDPATFFVDGIFTTASIPDRANSFVKIVNDGSEYIEVVSLAFNIFQNFGTCKPAGPDQP